MFNLNSICSLNKDDFLALVSSNETSAGSRHLGGGIYVLELPEKKKFIVACVEVPDNNIIGVAQKLTKWLQIFKGN